MDEAIRVGRYEVEKILGKGKNGFLYLARDPNTGLRVALKTVPSGGEPPDEIKDRLSKVGRILNHLELPNVGRIFEVFEDSGSLYVAREYIKGRPLSIHLSEAGPAPPAEVRERAAKVLNSLDAVHGKGVFHGHLTPDNLILDENGVLKIVDLSVSRPGTPEGDLRGDLAGVARVLLALSEGEFRSVDGVTTPGIHSGNLPPGWAPLLERAINLSSSRPFGSAGELLNALSEAGEATVDLPSPPILPDAPPPPTEKPAIRPPQEILPPPPRKEAARKARPLLSRGFWIVFLFSVVLLVGGAGIVYLLLTGKLNFSKPAEPPPVAKHEEVLPIPFEVETDPPGAALTLDGAPVEEVILDPDDPDVHRVEARLGCLSASRELRIGDSPKLTLTLKPGPYDLTVSSRPQGAAIYLDGRDSGYRTPAVIPLKGCSRVKVRLELEGRTPHEVTLDPKTQVALDAALPERPPKGSFVVGRGSVRMTLHLGDTQLGAAGESIPLDAGEHKIRVLAPYIRGRQEIDVVVKPGEETRVKPPSWSTGKVFIYGKEGKVYVDGSYLDELPVIGRPLAVGTHTVVAVDSAGTRVRTSWRIRRGDQRKAVDFQAKRFGDR